MKAMKFRRVRFRSNEKNHAEFIRGFESENYKHKLPDVANLIADMCLDPRKAFELRYSKEYYEHLRAALASSLPFCQGMAACYLMAENQKQN